MSALHAVRTALVVAGERDALVASGGALAAVTVVFAVAALLYGHRRSRLGDDGAARARLARARRVGSVLAYLVALAAMSAAGWFGVLNAAADSLPGGRTGLGATAATIAGLLAPAVAPVGVAAGTLPAARALDGDAGADARTVAHRLGGALLGLTGTAAVLVLGVTAANPETATGLGWVGTSVVLGVLLAAGAPWVARLLESVRTPTASERERIERACAEVGLRVVAVRVCDPDEGRAAVAVRGLPWRRHLFVGESLLSELDDDHLRACLALQAGRSRRFHPEVRALAVVVPVVLAGALVTGRLVVSGVDPVVGAAGVLLVGVVELWVGQRLVYRADDEAVGRTSRETVLETIGTFADLDRAPTLGRLRALRRMEPPLGHRIERLRERGARGPTPGDD